MQISPRNQRATLTACWIFPFGSYRVTSLREQPTAPLICHHPSLLCHASRGTSALATLWTPPVYRGYTTYPYLKIDRAL